MKEFKVYLEEDEVQVLTRFIAYTKAPFTLEEFLQSTAQSQCRVAVICMTNPDFWIGKSVLDVGAAEAQRMREKFGHEAL